MRAAFALPCGSARTAAWAAGVSALQGAVDRAQFCDAVAASACRGRPRSRYCASQRVPFATARSLRSKADLRSRAISASLESDELRSGSLPKPVSDLFEALRTHLLNDCACDVPKYLETALLALHLNGDELLAAPTRVEPHDHPFIIPIARDSQTQLCTAGLLRWPTPPENMPLPLVAASPEHPLQLVLIANSCEHYAHRMLAYYDFNELADEFAQLEALTKAAPLYKKGAVVKAGLGLLGYLLLNVGPFDDVYRAVAQRHLKGGDEQSALITVERMASKFPGWSASHAYNARLLRSVGRDAEARDAARFAIHLPLWTLDDDLAEIAKIAGYQQEDSLGKMFRGLSLDERVDEVQQGKAPEQVALDRAAYVLDRVVAEGASAKWSAEVKTELKTLYETARLPEVAKFVAL